MKTGAQLIITKVHKRRFRPTTYELLPVSYDGPYELKAGTGLKVTGVAKEQTDSDG